MMPDDAEKRRLAAIFVADVVGYSRLMAADESGTLARLRRLRTSLIDPQIAAHGGRLVKLMGDGMLVEFSSVTAALGCAAEIQTRIDEAEAGVEPEARIVLRIGINLGEIVVDGDDIYGDGVNVAARIEALAEPGGVAISGSTYDQAKDKVPVQFEFGGEQQLKNIPGPVRVYHARIGKRRAPLRRRLPRLWLALPVAGALAAAAAGAVYFWPPVPTEPAVERRLDLATAQASDAPSVIVMPFQNLSGNADQSYFSDGITDSIITDLSKVGSLLVIARNTSFSFQGQNIEVNAVAREMGVRYVVEGSVQRAGERVRISVRLVDALSGFHLWAEKMDREIGDLFALQDEIAGQIISALEVEMTQEERRALAKNYTDNLEAYDVYLRAWQFYWQFNDQSRQRAQQLLEEALQLDPNFARAQGLLAMTYTNQIGTSLHQSGQSLDRAFALAQRAVDLDPDIPQVHWVLALVQMFRSEFEAAEASANRAIALDPNYADAYGLLCWILQYEGEAERALQAIEVAKRLNPRAPFPYLNSESETYFSIGRYDEAIELSTEALRRNPAAQRQRLFLAAALALRGDVDDANWQIEELLLLDPGLTIAAMREIAPYRDASVNARLAEGLRLAGLPE
jgi:TolB-like protein/class 3 adenylate cyclase/cytochrome c-type biogenesis protein CcmH/NrfG